MLTAQDNNQLTLLSLLDLSAAFDTIDHTTLLERLQYTYGVTDTALAWFRSYLSGRFQTVHIKDSHSSPSALTCGVPQGSVLGPILFILYTQPISKIVSHHSLSHHCYSDDNQLYKSGPVTELPYIISSTQNCIADVKTWMTYNKLQLNDDKTELILIAPKRQSFSEPLPKSVLINDSDVLISQNACNLGVIFDQSLSFEKYVSSICRTCYLELRRISSIRHYLSEDSTKTLVCAFILSRLDYCNSLLAGCPKHLLDKLQKIQNNAARLIFQVNRTSHVTPLLSSLHWLPVDKRIAYKISLICYKSLHTLAPSYISDLLTLYTPSRQLRSSNDTSVLKIPVYRTKSSGYRSFSVQAPTIWNNLPHSIRSASSLPSFKTKLKTYLF